jgi:hypothetical protein
MLRGGANGSPAVRQEEASSSFFEKKEPKKLFSIPGVNAEARASSRDETK